MYLAVILDLFSRKVVGWAMRDHMRTELPLAALTMAIQRRRPPRPASCITPTVAVNLPRRSTAKP